MIDVTGIPLLPYTAAPIEFGFLQEPSSGAEAQYVERLGSRWAIRFATPPLALVGDAGRYWSGMLTQARREGARLAVPQPGVPTADPGAPVVATSTAAGRVVPLSGITPGRQIYRGQWLSFQRGGRRYFDQNLNDVIVSGGGTATITIANLLRKPLIAGDVVDLVAPKIEGQITDFQEWTVALDETVAFEFSIREMA